MEISVKDLPEGWCQLLAWGPCFCKGLAGEVCPSGANLHRIEAAGLDWDEEYDKAIPCLVILALA